MKNLLRIAEAQSALRRAAIYTTVISIAVGLVACGGGDGVDIAGGQDADPVVVDVPIAFVKRPVPPADDPMMPGSGVTNLSAAEPGAALYVRERASTAAEEKNITAGVAGNFADIRDLSVSFDGTRMLFSMRTPILPGVDEEDLPSWNIWEYQFENSSLRRVIGDIGVAEQAHDRFPQYLPDGRIVFSSTRQTQTAEVLIDEGRGQFPILEESRNEAAFLLHVMNDDGNEIHQITFGRSHDFYPSILSNGQVMFTRWEQGNNVDQLDLYRINPDGTGIELLYGSKSHFTGTGQNFVEFIQPRQAPDGKVIAIIRPRTGTYEGGQVVAIDVNNFVENTQPVASAAGISGRAQTIVSINDVNTEPGPSLGGRYASAFPLWDGTNRVFVSWSPCLGYNKNNEAQFCSLASVDLDRQPPPIYSIWIYSRNEDTQRPVVLAQSGFWFTDIVAAQERSRPDIIFDRTYALSSYPDLAADGWGILSVRSIYDVDGVDTRVPDIASYADPLAVPADQRAARFVRIVKPASIPDEEILDLPNSAFGVTSFFGMREIIAYAPIEPDGSIRVRVPANVPLGLELLDVNGKTLPGQDHDNWLQVLPGTEVTCHGCHDNDSDVSHGRSGAFPSAYPGATGSQFVNATATLAPFIGETMAETRTRVSCATDNCTALNASTDIEYADYWTPAIGAPAAPFTYAYAELETPPPISGACDIQWESACRIVINYEENIHPLWSLLRPTVDASGMDRQCASCHVTQLNIVTGLMEDAPAYLDLSEGQSDQNIDHYKAYRELAAGDNQLVDDGLGGLTNLLVDTGELDEFDQPILVPVGVSRSLTPGNAFNSGRFFSKFESGGSHEGWLSPAELKLIAEWVDIGAQYYNNPFDAPEN